jgi:DNA-binding CsgD family transcriptional regulator
MMFEIVGREDELASLHALIDEMRAGPAALVLEGEAGIGKSTLWLAGVEHARTRGLRVLSSRPAEADRGLAYVALGDLLEDVLDDVLPRLSPPRRRALEVALLIAEASGRRADPRAVAVGVRSSLQFLAADGPIVLAVDDVQWLDATSASALAFALRRLREQSVLLLLARRLGEGAEQSDLERAVEPGRCRHLLVRPLSVGAIHRILQARLQRSLARPPLLRVHEASGGNPFYAIELARALDPDVDPTKPLRLPETLEGLVRARLGRLPRPTREGLLLAAALGRASPILLAAAGVSEDVLAPALAAHVLEQTDGIVRFTHPLLASAVYQESSARERRRVHTRIAGIVDDPIVRVRHLALATQRPIATIAAALEEGAALALVRGAPIAAAELGEHALRLTPLDAHEDRHRRTLAAAGAHRAAGEWKRARTITLDLLSSTASGPARAEALVVLAELESAGHAVSLLRQALREAAAQPALQAVIHQRLAGAGRFAEGWQWAAEQACASLELAEGVDDDALRVGALLILGLLRFDMGDADADRLVERACELAASLDDPEQLKDANLALAHVLVWSREIDRARALLERQHDEWSERDEPFGAGVLWYLSLVEFSAGRWSLAAEYAERAHDVGVQYAEAETPQHFLPLALIAAHRGDHERARSYAARGRQLAERQGAQLPMPIAIPGLVDLWSRDAASAVRRFALAEEAANAASWGEPSLRWWRADYVEALLELGRTDDAVKVLDAWEADAARLGRRWVLAHATRCRGLVAAAHGDVEHAEALLEDAVSKDDASGDPFGRARALLVLGSIRRRARQKRRAREAIEAAVEAFETIGASGWAAKARAELGRISGRTRAEGLTPAERRVASLVAAGRTNREVAAGLFLGERTVASHLNHIYAKLGVRSRTELALRLRADEPT